MGKQFRVKRVFIILRNCQLAKLYKTPLPEMLPAINIKPGNIAVPGLFYSKDLPRFS